MIYKPLFALKPIRSMKNPKNIYNDNDNNVSKYTYNNVSQKYIPFAQTVYENTNLSKRWAFQNC